MSSKLDELFKDYQQTMLDVHFIYKKSMDGTLTDVEIRQIPQLLLQQRKATKAYKDYLKSIDRTTELFNRINL